MNTSITLNHAKSRSPFTPLQDEWVQLSPYGDFPHAQGLQRVDRAAADRMVQRFRSFTAKLGRAFGGLPFYVGHPDAPGMGAQFTDRKAYGWIMDLEAREGGLFGKAKWSDAGRALVENAHYKFVSPFWEAEEISSGIFSPVRLISAGLTNQPNIPVLPLSNSSAPTPAQSNGGMVCVGGAAPLSAGDSNITALLDEAIVVGRIRAAERGLWNEKLASDFATHAKALANLKPAEAPKSLRLRERKPAIAEFHERQQQIQRLVRARMAEGFDYHTAWGQIKTEHPALFAGSAA